MQGGEYSATVIIINVANGGTGVCCVYVVIGASLILYTRLMQSINGQALKSAGQYERVALKMFYDVIHEVIKIFKYYLCI